MPSFRRASIAIGALLFAAIGCQAFLDSESNTHPASADASTSDSTIDVELSEAAADDAPLTDGCGDLETPRNCGYCGHDCLQGACEAGKCLPFLVTDQATSPGYIALDPAHIYWARLPTADAGVEAGRIERIPRDGGQTITALTPELASGKLVLDDPYVYFTIGGAAVSRVRNDEADAEPISIYPQTGVLEVRDLAIAGNDLVVAVGSGSYSALFRRSKQPGDVTGYTLIDNLEYLRSLAVSGTNYYAGEIRPQSAPVAPEIYVSDGGATEIVARAEPMHIVADTTNLYWTEYSQNAVYRISQSERDAAGGVPVAVGQNPSLEGSLAIDDTFLYWVTPQASGFVYRARKDADGGAPEVIASDQRTPLGLAVDDKAVCWSEWERGKIWCVAK
jgi:hypothetical protein